MTKLISSALGIIFGFFADHLLIKWVGHVRLWWHKYDNKKLKAETDARYVEMLKEWDKLKDKRHSLKD